MTRIAFDMSSVIWTSLLVGKDEENGRVVPHPFDNEKTCHVNSAAYGYENAMNMMTSALAAWQLSPIDTLLVFEGLHSKKYRLAIDPNYKGNRSDRPAEAYVEFEKLRDQLKALWLSLGANALTQNYVEGDDTLAWLARETEQDLIIDSRDGDLTVLNNERNAHGAKVSVVCGDRKIGENPYGPWDLALIPAYKALVGDNGDNIKGVVGFGKGKWIDFLVKYGEDGAQELVTMLEAGNLAELHPMAADCKLVKMIVEQEENAIRCYRLGKLYPDQVNTFKTPLKIEAGMVKNLPPSPDERVAQWYGRSRLVTADNFAQACEWALPIIAKSPFIALDIESSTSDESDEWLLAQGKPDGLDMIGSTLSSLQVTFGANTQYSLYFAVDNADTNNIPSLTLLRQFIDKLAPIPIVIQNFAGAEGPVLFNEWGEHIADRSCDGFLPRVLDTMLEASYVDENNKRGLKDRSKSLLGYEQQTYEQTTRLTGPVGALPPGGRRVGEVETKELEMEVTGIDPDTGKHFVVKPAVTQEVETRRYKMNELSAAHCFGYGVDDTICTAALHVHYRLIMELEHSWEIYKEVELPAAYLHALSYVRGVDVSIERSNELMRIDDETYAKAWEVVSAYLIKVGFEGTLTPQVDNQPLVAADIKEIFEIYTKRKLDSQIRTPSKLVTYIREVANEPSLALLLEGMIVEKPTDAAVALLNQMLTERFDKTPENPVGSPTKMAHLLYEVMKLPVKVRNKATDIMRSKGIRHGNPKTDVLAIEYALKTATPEQAEVLKSLKLMQMVKTRHGLYYDAYPGFVHWKTGRVHSSHNQAATNTRRATESSPNKTQLAKHEKIEGESPRYREVIVPHAEDAVVVSLDFESQELVIIAEKSRDTNLIECFVPPPGKKKKKQHNITGLGIFKKQQKMPNLTYEEFAAMVEDKAHPLHAKAKIAYALGKKLNFTAEYGAMAPKVKDTLLLDTEDEAQDFLDAREAEFPGVKKWKERVIAQVKKTGMVFTMLGAPRHLREGILAGGYEAMKAERQGVNAEVQASAAEQTKLAEGRMWSDRLFTEFDARYIGPVHDECVASVLIKDLPEVLPRMHACMVKNYAGISAVPIKSSISFGRSFGPKDQIEIGNEPTLEAINSGLAAMRAAIEKETAHAD